jgi:hypothetical protein
VYATAKEIRILSGCEDVNADEPTNTAEVESNANRPLWIMPTAARPNAPKHQSAKRTPHSGLYAVIAPTIEITAIMRLLPENIKVVRKKMV